MNNYNMAIYGLGVMGSSLFKNILDNNIPCAAFSKNKLELERFNYEGSNGDWKLYDNYEEMLSNLSSPRVIFLMITAGKPIDLVINELLPHLNKGDIIIDGGNSHFEDTYRRKELLNSNGINFLGIGVSGGEKGALTGPSMMVGGDKDAWEVSKHILRKISAKFNEYPCCDYLGPDGSGHFVKMVHNGIEYAIMQLISDVYNILKNGFSIDNNAVIDIFKVFTSSKLNSYLLDTAINVLSQNDSDGTPLVEKIVDVASQKGTGSWTLKEAINLGVYIPTISEAVFTRYFSANKDLRSHGSNLLTFSKINFNIDNPAEKLQDALLASILCSYAQGLDLINKASLTYNWNIDLRKVVSLWFNGCIIKGDILIDIFDSLDKNTENILLTPNLSYIKSLEPSLREVVLFAQSQCIGVPTLSSTLSYYDYLHSEKLPLNLVQGMRDCFGAHTYKRIDMDGDFHTDWL